MIELLITIGLIGVLTSAMIIIINPVGHLQKSRDGVRKSDLRQIQAALELYRADQGSYPPTLRLATCGGALAEGAVTYMPKIPCDPLSPGTTSYAYTAGGSNFSYTIRACLEYANDPQKDPTSVGCTSPRVSYTLQNP